MANVQPSRFIRSPAPGTGLGETLPVAFGAHPARLPAAMLELLDRLRRLT